MKTASRFILFWVLIGAGQAGIVYLLREVTGRPQESLDMVTVGVWALTTTLAAFLATVVMRPDKWDEF